ncbi:MAG: Calx-beta domain-containing protein [Steroidobacteraceae bacterium]
MKERIPNAWRRRIALLGVVLLLSQAQAASVVYEYDQLGRLKTATFDGAKRVAYGLDAAGNRTQVSTFTGGALQIALSSYSVNEGGGTVTLSVQRVGSTSGAASVVAATSNGTAVAGSDYVGKTQTLSWASGDGAAKNFVVTITQDGANEGSQTFNVTLSNATGGWIGTPTAAIVTILDDDAASAGTLQFTSGSGSVAEAATTVTRNVSRTGGSNGAVSVICATADGTATAGADYVAKSVTLNWANGNTSNKACTISLLDDLHVEGNQLFTLTLESASGAALGATKTSTVTITDDDFAVPGIPPNLRTSPTGISFGGNYSVLWDAATGSPAYYVLEEQQDGGGFNTSYTINAPTLFKAFNKGDINAIFTYRVKACNVNNQCSGYSNQVTKIVCPSSGCP